MKAFKYIFCWLLPVLCLAPVLDKSATVLLPEVPEANLNNAEVRVDASGKRFYTIADVTYTRRQDPLIMDAVFSMNKPAEKLFKDDLGRYKIKRAQYVYLTGKGELGEACAGFFSPKHMIEIECNPNMFLGKPEDLGSFALEFRLFSPALVNGGMIFSKTGYFSGSKRGIEIFIKNRRVAVYFYNLFKDSSGKRHTLFLTGGKALNTGKWHHFAVSFDRLNGKLAKYLDGIEDEVRFATADGTSYSEVFVPAFGEGEGGVWAAVDESSAKIGGGFNGLLDEFRISYLTLPALKEVKPVADKRYMELKHYDRLPFNREGIITSPVLEFPSTGCKVINFDWDEILPLHTFIWAEFRISDSYFHEQDNTLRWYRIDKGQRDIYAMETVDGVLLRGKYYQWRVHLISSPDGKRAPSMWAARIVAQPDNPPAIPRLVQVAEAGDGYIRLKWLRNTDADILGYRIYYGTVPGRYDGILQTVEGALITNAQADKDGFIEVTINNDVIEENKKKHRNRLLTYPVLRNTVLYFLAVTAYDNYRPDTNHNHESACSTPVTGRPYGGSEIKPAVKKPLD